MVQRAFIRALLYWGGTSTDTYASVRRAEKGVDLLKGPEAGVMTAVYKELGVKPLAGAAVEGMATSLFHDMSAAFSKRKPSDNATAARRRVLQNLRRKGCKGGNQVSCGDQKDPRIPRMTPVCQHRLSAG